MKNCVAGWPAWVCGLGNGASYCSMALWFLVLLPQLLRNQRRRAVAGLNPLWALANFTASLCNAFFVFSLSPPLPLGNRVMAVYMPVLEGAMLLQFLAWWRPSSAAGGGSGVGDGVGRPTAVWGVVFGACAVWAAVVAVALLVPGGPAVLAWAAIALWSVETFPQLFTNLRHPTAAAAGQSLLSVAVTCVGKTSDSLNAYLLVMPTQYRVLAWFSGASAWINALHVMVFFVAPPPELVGTAAAAAGDSDSASTGQAVNDDVASRGSETTGLVAPVPDAAAAGCGCAAAVGRAADAAEAGLRAWLRRYTAARAAVGAVLTALIVGALAGVVATVWRWWVAALPLGTALIVAVFHATAAGCRRDPTPGCGTTAETTAAVAAS